MLDHSCGIVWQLGIYSVCYFETRDVLEIDKKLFFAGISVDEGIHILLFIYHKRIKCYIQNLFIVGPCHVELAFNL